ncbi:MAG: hypothetical protein AB8G22_28785, partial [Saprospiraceae bacterium]
MPITQLGLKATLHDLKMICRQQFFLAQTIHGFNHPAIEAAIFDAKNTFREFDRMEVWLTPFDFDMLQWLQIMMQIDQVQGIHLDSFTDAITALTDFLQNEVLEPPVLAASVEIAEPQIAAA